MKINYTERRVSGLWSSPRVKRERRTVANLSKIDSNYQGKVSVHAPPLSGCVKRAAGCANNMHTEGISSDKAIAVVAGSASRSKVCETIERQRINEGAARGLPYVHQVFRIFSHFITRFRLTRILRQLTRNILSTVHKHDPETPAGISGRGPRRWLPGCSGTNSLRPSSPLGISLIKPIQTGHHPCSSGCCPLQGLGFWKGTMLEYIGVGIWWRRSKN